MHEELLRVKTLYRDYLSPDLARLFMFGGLAGIECEAQGSWVVDDQGNRYLDFCAGYGTFSLGHRHPDVIAAVKAQLDRLPLSSKVFFSKPQAQLAELLAEITPGDLRFSFFCNSGAEAVEGALKIARAATSRPHFVATQNAFHGKTFGALSVSGRPLYQDPFHPLLSDVRHVPFGDLEAMESAIDEETAAVIVEPIQGEGGIHVAPSGYLKGIQDRCKETGTLLIADEVQTGFGRTGALFAVDHWSVQPDIMCFAKALGGGVMPIGAYIVTPTVIKAYKGKPLIHTSTFGGNPLACTAALAMLHVLEREELVHEAQAAGTYLMEQLRAIARMIPAVIKEVRGLGLMIGIEFTDPGYAGSVISEMGKRRVIAVYTLNQPAVIRFEPPLNISRKEIDIALTAFHEAVGIAGLMNIRKETILT